EDATLAEDALVDGPHHPSRLDHFDGGELIELAVCAARQVDYAHAAAAENALRLEDAKGGQVGWAQGHCIFGDQAVDGGQHLRVGAAFCCEKSVALRAGGKIQRGLK